MCTEVAFDLAFVPTKERDRDDDEQRDRAVVQERRSLGSDAEPHDGDGERDHRPEQRARDELRDRGHARSDDQRVGGERGRRSRQEHDAEQTVCAYEREGAHRAEGESTVQRRAREALPQHEQRDRRDHEHGEPDAQEPHVPRAQVVLAQRNEHSPREQPHHEREPRRDEEPSLAGGQLHVHRAFVLFFEPDSLLELVERALDLSVTAHDLAEVTASSAGVLEGELVARERATHPVEPLARVGVVRPFAEGLLVPEAALRRELRERALVEGLRRERADERREPIVGLRADRDGRAVRAIALNRLAKRARARWANVAITRQ